MGLVIILLAWKLNQCIGTPDNSGTYLQEIATLHNDISRITAEAARKDSLYADSIKVLRNARKPGRIKHDSVMVYIPTIVTDNDTIIQLVVAVQNCDTLLKSTEAENQLWESRYQEKDQYADSLQVIIPKIERAGKKEIARKDAELKKVRFGKAVAWIVGGAATVTAVVAIAIR